MDNVIPFKPKKDQPSNHSCDSQYYVVCRCTDDDQLFLPVFDLNNQLTLLHCPLCDDELNVENGRIIEYLE